jgi:pilus assembly protein Flp/PilA
MRLIRTVLRDRRGATAIEYALIASLIAVAAITAFKNVGSSSATTFNNVQGELGAAS